MRIHATCEDYRAGRTTDLAHDEADRAAGQKIACPLLAIWGAAGGIPAETEGPLATWREWAIDVRGFAARLRALSRRGGAGGDGEGAARVLHFGPVTVACSFWLVDNYILQGRYTDARELFDRLLSRCNDVGLLAEEFDPRTGRMLGNFPQAYSHVGLINCALNLSPQTGPAEKRAESQAPLITVAPTSAVNVLG